MAKEQQQPTGGAVHEIKCELNKGAKPAWGCCDLQQFCAKLDEINKLAAKGRLDESAAQARNAREGEGRFRREWNQAPWTHAPHPSRAFYHDCAYARALANDLQVGNEVQPDHVHELQLGGPATHQTNFKWISTSVNRSLGPHLSGYHPETHPGGVSADCCPAEETPKCPDQESQDLDARLNQFKYG
jgi:hypothetical protein